MFYMYPLFIIASLHGADENTQISTVMARN